MLFATALGLASLTAGAARAQDTCTGDCNLNGVVTINELILGVGISLGNQLVTACPAFDANDNGVVAITEIIAAVGKSLNGCDDEPPVGFCGDGDVNVPGETCDDGNNLGGDECAANCTEQVRRMTVLDPARAGATVQLSNLTIPLNLTGTQVLTAGMPRDTAVEGPDGKLYNAGDIPIVIKAEDVQFDKIPVFGLVCACVRGVPVEGFGEGISGTGKAACGTVPITDINFIVEVDHNTTPGNAGNGGPENGLPDDPTCSSVYEVFPGSSTVACVEGTGPTCMTPDNEHIGVCISPRVISYSGGAAPRGSVSLLNNSAIGLLQDGATCGTDSRNPNGSCKYADYGPDCEPCTDDDEEKGIANLSPTVSGTAEVAIYDFRNQAGVTLNDAATCGGNPPVACITKVSGEPLDNCDALLTDPNAPLRAVLVTAFPSIDSAMIGDNVVTTTLAPIQ
ncbi:MAG: hypothetical protein ACRERC_15180 [Candidatus Binatia bacterium]